MSFTPEQNKALGADLDRSKVKSRQQGGRGVSYIEGWVVIAEANRIFGFDGWSRQTIDLQCVSERERKLSSGADAWGVTYTAKVRITVGELVREGCGSGHGIDRDCGQAHESALKEAETDAMKRALMTFGNPFGLALYDKEQRHVSDNVEPPQDDTAKREYIDSCYRHIKDERNPKHLLEWWNATEQKEARRDFELTTDEVTALKDRVLTRKAELTPTLAAG